MAENSKIEWTDHTFNPWIGCTKVHAGCEHCYAESMMDQRWGKVKWGPNGTRVVTSDAMWKKPLQWNKAAAKSGRPALVFCASLADVFERWTDDKFVMRSDGTKLTDGEEYETLGGVRAQLFRLFAATPHLRWLVLTKRPENIQHMWPLDYSDDACERPPHIKLPNVWLGTSPCDQATADKAIPELLKCRDYCGGLFLSCEPLVGPLDLMKVGVDEWDVVHGWKPHVEPEGANTDRIDWVIVGGESGHGARPMHPDWVRSIRDQCGRSGVPFFFKQWGELVTRPVDPKAENGHVFTLQSDGTEVSYCKQSHTGDWFRLDPDQWRNIKDYPGGLLQLVNVGKKAAGRSLDGCEWSEFPAAFRRTPELAAV